MTDSAYRVIFADVTTDETLDVLPVNDIEIDDYIGKPGSFTGTIPVPDRAMASRAARLIEGRTAVYLARGNDLWWGGILWTMSPQCDDRGVVTCPIQAGTFDSYAGRRYIRADLSYPQTDQFTVVQNLWDYMQLTTPGGNVKVTHGTETSGTLISPSWQDGDETLVDEAINQLAAASPGFEYFVGVYADPVSGNRVRQLRLGAPAIAAGAAPLVASKPGSIVTYTFPRDATRGGTTALVRGASAPAADGTGQDRPMTSQEYVATDQLSAGYLRLDTSADYSDVSDQPTLEVLAQARLAAAGTSVVVPALTVRLDDEFTPGMLGASVRVRIVDEWFPAGLDQTYRIVGYRLLPAQRGRPDTIDLYLDGAS
jgi:hypothetical protein